jgi:hypothetical protein
LQHTIKEIAPNRSALNWRSIRRKKKQQEEEEEEEQEAEEEEAEEEKSFCFVLRAQGQGCVFCFWWQKQRSFLLKSRPCERVSF